MLFFLYFFVTFEIALFVCRTISSVVLPTFDIVGYWELVHYRSIDEDEVGIAQIVLLHKGDYY